MFNYTDHLAELIRHACLIVPELSHIDCDRIHVGYAPAKTDGEYGLYAKIVPLRFVDGAETMRKGRYLYRMPDVYYNGRQILYILYFCMPKFANLKFETKLSVIFHELYHISPLFNGDIRRFPGRNYVHGSKKKYSEKIRALAQEYLNRCDGYRPFEFLRMDMNELERRHGRVVAARMQQPKAIVTKVTDSEKEAA